MIQVKSYRDLTVWPKSMNVVVRCYQFVKNTPWVHLDIAGPVWVDAENGYNNQGATGYGVRTLVNWVLSQWELHQAVEGNRLKSRQVKVLK